MHRNTVVTDCVGVVTACWNYYSDIPLSEEEVAHLSSYMDRVLPAKIETSQWEDYAKSYDEENMVT